MSGHIKSEEEKKLEEQELFFIDPEDEPELNVTDVDPLYSDAFLEDSKEPEDDYDENTTSFD